MKENCPLCYIMEEKFRLVAQGNKVYASIPLQPIIEGHVMVAPNRHTTMDEMCNEEITELHDFVTGLKTKLMEFYPEKHPTIFAYADGDHASIPTHYHVHLVPSEVKMRVFMSNYNPDIELGKEATKSELEKMAELLRDES